MKWILIDKDNLPENEVLAANFEIGTYGYKEKIVGYLSEDDGNVTCDSDDQCLENCTHYIDIHKFDI